MEVRNLGPAKKPTGMIDMNQALEMQSVYVENEYSAINDMLHQKFGDNHNDTREYVFKFEELYGYLQEVANNLVDVPFENIGIRVYLGGKMVNSGGSEVPNTTVFFVAATKEGDNYNNNPSAGMLNYGNAGNPPFVLSPE